MGIITETGVQCRSTGTYRSAISKFHDPIHCTSVFLHNDKNPPQPKYTFIWNVKAVLNFLRKLPENDKLSDRLLALKKTMLLALLSASRMLEIPNLNMAYITKSSTAYTFCFRSCEFYNTA